MKIYVVTYEYYDSFNEIIQSYRVLGVANTMEKAIAIIKNDFKDGDDLSEYECDISGEFFRYRCCDGVYETYYFVEAFEMNE